MSHQRPRGDSRPRLSGGAKPRSSYVRRQLRRQTQSSFARPDSRGRLSPRGCRRDLETLGTDERPHFREQNFAWAACSFHGQGSIVLPSPSGERGNDGQAIRSVLGFHNCVVADSGGSRSGQSSKEFARWPMGRQCHQERPGKVHLDRTERSFKPGENDSLRQRNPVGQPGAWQQKGE